MAHTQKKPWWKRKTTWGAAGFVLVMGAIGSSLNGGDTTTATITAASTMTPAMAAATTEAASVETTQASDTTTGGIGYGEAAAACDKAAQEQLFPGADYNSDPIIGEQKAQPGLDPAQFIAVYNVKVDGRKTAITCLVDGDKSAPNVISVKETDPA